MSAPGRQGYGAVAGVVVFLAIINGLAVVARRAIPPPDPNPALMGRGDFLERGALQLVRWQPATPDSMAAAKRAGKPILIVAGSRVSPLARAFDDRVFDNPEVAERINREFTSLRVDVFTQPEWRAFFVPMTKLRLGADMNFDIAVLDTSGRLVSNALLNPRTSKADEAVFQDFLGSSLKQVQSEDSELSRDQEDQIGLLESPSIRELPDPVRGEGVDDGVDLLPWNLRLKIALGQKEAALGRVDMLLSGPAYDWQGWGFFSQALNPEWTQVAPIKEATRTHDMGVMLARLGLSTGRSDLLLIAKLCLGRPGFYRTGFTELIDVLADGRIEGRSVPTSFLREGIDPELRQDSVDLWQLDPGSNPQMLPHPSSTSDLAANPGAFTRVMTGIMRRQPLKPEALAIEEAWFTGSAAARIMEGAAILDDPDLRERGEREWDRVQAFRSGPDDVIRAGAKTFPGGLADYLGYADAAYWRWTAYGDEDALQQGEAVLKRAWFLFANDTDGTLVAAGQSGPKLGEYRPNMPLWFDAERGSDPGRMAMLWLAYGRVLSNDRYLDRARKVLLRYGIYANTIPGRSGALMLAAHQLSGAAGFRVAGKNAPRLWRAWTVARPGALVVRVPDKDLKPGVWRNAGGETVRMPDNPALAGLPPPAGTSPTDGEPGA
jgi:hypothetical protein